MRAVELVRAFHDERVNEIKIWEEGCPSEASDSTTRIAKAQEIRNNAVAERHNSNKKEKLDFKLIGDRVPETLSDTTKVFSQKT